MLVYHSVSSFQCGQNIHPASCKVCFISAWSHGKTWENIALCLKFNIYMLCKCVYRIYIYICIYGYCVWISYLCINMYTYTCRYIISNTHIPLYLLHIHVCMNFRKRWRFTQSRCPSAVKVFPGGSTSTSRTNLRSMWPLTSENSSNPQTSSIVGGRESRQHNPTHTHTTDKQKNTSLFGPSQMWLKTMCFSTVFFHMISY